MPLIVAVMFAVGGFFGVMVEDSYNKEPDVRIETHHQVQEPLVIDFRCEENKIKGD